MSVNFSLLVLLLHVFAVFAVFCVLLKKRALIWFCFQGTPLNVWLIFEAGLPELFLGISAIRLCGLDFCMLHTKQTLLMRCCSAVVCLMFVSSFSSVKFLFGLRFVFNRYIFQLNKNESRQLVSVGCFVLINGALGLIEAAKSSYHHLNQFCAPKRSPRTIWTNCLCFLFERSCEIRSRGK